MQVKDRTAINKKLTLDNYFPPFFSVLLPELGRPECVIRACKHLVEHADMPFEIIVHDDASGLAKQTKLLNELQQLTSVLILNTSRNIGLAGSLNRCRKVASSNFLLKMDVDDYITSGMLKNLKAALDLPYCGIVNFVPKIQLNPGDPGLYISPNGSKVSLCMAPALTSLVFGVRGDVWDSVGGWDELVQTTASDGGFIASVFGKGMFTLVVEGSYLNEQWLTDDGIVNNKEVNPNYISSARFSSGDNNCPRIHGLHGNIKDKLDFVKQRIRNNEEIQHKAVSAERAADIWHSTNDDRLACMDNPVLDNSWYSPPFYESEVRKLFPDGKFVDWEFAKEHGHLKWKDQIIRDFNLGGAA